MIGKTFKHRETGAIWRCTGDNQDGRWVLTPVAFGPNVPFTAAELRKTFVRAGDVAEAPAEPSYDAETEGWQRLSAEARFKAIAEAVESGAIQPGDTLTVPGFDGEPIDATHPLTKDEVGRLRAAARKLRGPVAPTPEGVFAAGQADEIQAAAQKITGSPETLASYETGQLDCAPSVAAIVDRFIRDRNRREDRQAYPSAHVFDRGGR